MKRLFQVKADGAQFFEKKKDAKEFRDLHRGSHVSLGPDHWRKA